MHIFPTFYDIQQIGIFRKKDIHFFNIRTGIFQGVVNVFVKIIIQPIRCRMEIDHIKMIHRTLLYYNIPVLIASKKVFHFNGFAILCARLHTDVLKIA